MVNEQCRGQGGDRAVKVSRREACSLLLGALTLPTATDARRVHTVVNASDVDEQAIRGVLSAFDDARNNLDAKAVVRLFAPDGEFTTPIGRSYRGQHAIQQFFAATFGDPEMRSSRSTREIRQIRFVRSDAALVDVVGELRTPARVIHVLKIALLTKNDHAWRIASMYHTHLIE